MKKHYLALVLTLFVLPIFAQNIPNYVPKDGLVGYWPFNGNTNDESGNGRNGINNQVSASDDRFGNAKSSYYFDGTSSYIEVSNSSNIEMGGNDFTISVWVNNSSNLKSSTFNLISKKLNTLIISGLIPGASNEKYGVGFDTYGKNYALNSNILPITGWNHIVCVKTTIGYNVYINNVKYKISYNNNNSSRTDITEPLFFGKRVGGYLGTNFSGYLDDIAIHNRALTESEIQALYEGNACPLKASISPLGSVKICEGSSIVLQSADSTHVYQWFKDKQEIAGATSKSYTATKAGQYAVRVSDPTCSSMSPVTTIDTIPLPAAPILNNNIQKVCQMETIEMISQRLTNYNSTISLKWYREETGNDSINKYMTIDPYPRNYYVSQLSATSPQCESPKRTMVFMDVNMPVFVNAKGNTTFCKGDSVVLEASATNGNQYDYAWKKDYNWIDGTEGKNTFVAKESGRYSYQNRMCGMQMNGNEMEVFVKQGLKVNVGKITGSSVEFVWDTLSLSPTPKDFVINYGINSTSLTQNIATTGGTSYTFTGLNKGDTVRVSITPKGTDCTTPSFASAIATEIGLPNNIPTNGLVGYWPFNGNANDESGNGNDGTVNGATLTADRNGKPNSAYSFDGKSNYISIKKNDILNIKSNISSSIWFNIKEWDKNSNSWASLISKSTSPSFCNYRISINTEFVSFIYGGKDYYIKYDPSIIKWNVWNHIIVIMENKSLNIYINNLRLTNNATFESFSDGENMDLEFGRDQPGATDYFNGKLDDIAIYNRALSEQEIKQLYNGCPKETATSSSFNSLLLSTGSSVSISAEPKGGTFSGVTIENNQFIPNKAKIGLNKVQYNFKNSQGCNDSTLFSIIVADTVGAKCTKIDTITVKNNVYDTVKVTKFDTITIKNNVYDTVTITNNITKYDTVIVNKYDTITVTNNVTKYDTIKLTDTVSILKITFKLTTGIQANQMASMSLYPNPTTDVLHIEVGDAKALDGYRYRILDALGKEVYNELVKNAITEIPLKTLGATGMYQFEVLDEQNTSIQTNKIALQ